MTKYKIADARIAKGWSQQELADKMDTTQQTIQRYESGARDIKTSVVLKLSAVLGVTVSYLLGMTDNNEPEDDFVDVPLYGSIAAGTPILMDSAESMHPVPTIVRKRYPDAFLLRVEGNSMNRILPNGSFALINPCEDVTADNKPYAVCVNGYSATIKRVRKLANGFELAPDSIDPTYKPVVYDYGVEGTETITVIGRVVWYCVPFDWEF